MLVQKLHPKERFVINGHITVVKMAGDARSYGFVGKGTIRVVGKGGVDRTFRLDDDLVTHDGEWETSNDLLARYSSHNAIA